MYDETVPNLDGDDWDSCKITLDSTFSQFQSFLKIAITVGFYKHMSIPSCISALWSLKTQ